jgi:hypothetical protein
MSRQQRAMMVTQIRIVILNKLCYLDGSNIEDKYTLSLTNEDSG